MVEVIHTFQIKIVYELLNIFLPSHNHFKKPWLRKRRHNIALDYVLKRNNLIFVLLKVMKWSQSLTMFSLKVNYYCILETLGRLNEFI